MPLTTASISDSKLASVKLEPLVSQHMRRDGVPLLSESRHQRALYMRKIAIYEARREKPNIPGDR